MFDLIQAYDENIMLFFQEQIRNAFLNPIMVFFSYIGYVGTIWIVISLILIGRKNTRRVGIVTLLTMLICYCVNDLIIKEIFQRPRPFETMPELAILTFIPGSASFPSGHACSSFASAYILTRSFGKRGSLAYILAALIAISRPYVGVHYLSDVIVGAVVGTVGAIIIFTVCKRTGLYKSPRLNENM